MSAAVKSIRRFGGNVAFDVFVSPNTRNPELVGVVECDNVVVDRFLSGGYDYLWMVELDTIVPSCAFEKLFNLDVDVALGYYPSHGDFNRLIAGWVGEDAKIYYLPRFALKGQVLRGWVFAGSGCMLVKRKVFSSGLRFKLVRLAGPDIVFMFEVLKAGFSAALHGDVECGHLPEWPFPFKVLDVGCGRKPQGDVNVDLFPEPSAHRSVDQRALDGALDVKAIKNFVKADACHLPFRDGVFERVVSNQTLEHVECAELAVKEFVRVSDDVVEVVCPHPKSPWGVNAGKPLHRAVWPEWLKDLLRTWRGISYDVRSNEEDPGNVSVKIVKGNVHD